MAHDRDPNLPPSAIEEIGFWEEELTLKGEHPDEMARRMDPQRRHEVFPPMLRSPLLPMIRQHFGLEGPARCLELGSGPLSALAWGVTTGLLEVTAVDVLADHYADLLARHGVADYPVRPIAGSGESLLELLAGKTFHLTYVSNALDHTNDAPRVFDNLVRLTMVDGAVMLQHHLTEGTHRNWSDSHKWDLDLGGEGLVARNRAGQTLSLDGGRTWSWFT